MAVYRDIYNLPCFVESIPHGLNSARALHQRGAFPTINAGTMQELHLSSLGNWKGLWALSRATFYRYHIIILVLFIGKNRRIRVLDNDTISG